MARQLCISVVVDLPENPFDAADVYRALNAPWSGLLNALKDNSIRHDAKLDEMEVRAKRRPRKPRLVPPQEAA